MKRLGSVVCYLGVKRLIASALLGVVFPLLFAAWVASRPTMFRASRLHLDQEEYFEEDGAFGRMRRNLVVHEQLAVHYWDFDDRGAQSFRQLFSRENRVSQFEVPDWIPADAKTWLIRLTGWPGRTLVWESRIHSEEDGRRIDSVTRSISVPRGWKRPLIGRGDIPLRIHPAGLAINGLLYSPISYLLLSMPVALRHLLRTRRGLCTRCGYDLAGLASCPECGKDRP